MKDNKMVLYQSQYFINRLEITTYILLVHIYEESKRVLNSFTVFHVW